MPSINEWLISISLVVALASGGCDRLRRATRGGPAASGIPIASTSASSDVLQRAAPAPSASIEQMAQPVEGSLTSTRAVPLPLTVMAMGSASLEVALGRSYTGADALPASRGPYPGESSSLVPQRPPGARDYPQNIADRPVPRIGSQPWMINPEWEARHERQLQSPRRAGAKVVFLGDSITDAWGKSSAYKEHFDKYSPLNLGITREYTQNLLWRIEHGALDGLAPDAVVIMIGVNNLGGGFTAEQTASGVRAVVAAVRSRLPKTPVLLLAILPANENPDSALRKKIVETNRLIAALAQPGSVIVEDVGAVLVEPDGKLSRSILRDFLHPTDVGYDRLSQAVAPLLDKLVRHE